MPLIFRRFCFRRQRFSSAFIAITATLMIFFLSFRRFSPFAFAIFHRFRHASIIADCRDEAFADDFRHYFRRFCRD
jgi:hypothetical protein